LSKITPTLLMHPKYKIFFMFASINIGAMCTFPLLIPETKGRSPKEMDVIFGATTKEAREEHIGERERGLGESSYCFVECVKLIVLCRLCS
jgi:hypothetical protein